MSALWFENLTFLRSESLSNKDFDRQPRHAHADTWIAAIGRSKVRWALSNVGRNEIKANAESIFQAAASIGVVTCVHVGIRIYSHVTRYIYIVHSTTAVRVLGGCLHCNIEERCLF